MNKRKILESARKLAQKGSKDKALAEYQKLLKLDPKDAKLRLEIGDAHRRWGQVDQAVDTYTRVADQYMNEGFDARAVAVFKQILNLDPDRFDAYGPLAELYERMGLTAEAIGALQTAADGYHRQGRKDEALDLLRRMANVDPSNTTSRIKVADLLRQQEKIEDAVAEYRLAAEELERQGDRETVGTVYRRILEADETDVSALSQLAKNLASRGKVSEAIPLAERALQLDDANAEHYEALAELFERTERPADRQKVLRSLADLYRQRGDDDLARDILQRFVTGGEFDAGAESDELDGGGLGGDEALFDDRFPESEGAPEFSVDFGGDIGIDPDATGSGRAIDPGLAGDDLPGEEGEELLLEEVSEAPSPAPTDEDVDAEQLLAEATVYLRYGKSEKAIAHLERVIAAAPDHRVALEKLGEAFAESGDHERAVGLWVRAAEGARAEGDEDALRVLRGRIAVLDEDAAAGLMPAPAAPAMSGSAPAEAPPVDVLEFDAEDDELLLDDDGFLDEIGSPAAPSPSAEPGNEEVEPEIALDLDADLDAEGEAEADAPAAAPVPGASLSATSKQQVLDDLEEADFYMQQGLHEEAEAIYRRVLALSPGHPRALLRLGEIAAARGGSPGGVSEVVDNDQTPVPDIDLDDEDTFGAAAEAPAEEPEEELEISLDPAELGLDSGEPEPAAAEGLEDLSELDLGDVSGDLPTVEEGDPGDSGDATADASADGSDTQELRPGAESAAPPAAVGTPVHPDLEGSEGDFDLAAALSDAFDEDSASNLGAIAAAADDGFEAVFDAFKKGVSETLAEGDHQAHYDLAIAYKEMGLLDDAIDELRTAMADPGRTAECLHLIGLCAIDADQAPLAVEHLEQLLMLPDLDADAALAARFDLGRALAALGDSDGARSAWETVAATRPDFQDVTERLAGLGSAKPEPEDDGFESFEDVMADVDAEPEPAGADAGGETFEDLVAEVSEEAEPAEAEVLLEVEAIDEPVPDAEDAGDDADEPEAAPAAPRRARAKPAAKRKKKKISFL